MTERCDKARTSGTAPSLAQVDPAAEDYDDVHYCKRCKQEFTSLHIYLEHKIQYDNCKVIYARSSHDRRVIVPKLVQRDTKVKKCVPKEESIDGKENQQRPHKRGGRGRQKVPDVDQKLMMEKIAYMCEICSKTFKRQAALRRHLKYDHNNSDNEEDEDEDVKVAETGEEKKENTDDAEPEYVEHKSSASDKSNRPHTCRICQCSFKKIVVLKTHMLTHSNKREHLCIFEGCSYAFKTKGSLIRHMRRHTGERPYTCSMCKRSFTESGALSRHLKSRTPCTAKSDYDLPCYGQRWNFVSNIPAAMGKMQGQSENGGLDGQNITVNSPRIANTVGNYVQQSASGTTQSIGENTCEAGDLETVNITVSTSQHNEDDNSDMPLVENPELLRPTQCWVCSEDFTCFDALRVHLRTHLADMPFRCGLCHFVAEKRPDLSRHMLSQHKTELKGAEEALASRSTILDNDVYIHESEDTNKDLICRNARIAVNQLLNLKEKTKLGSVEEENHSETSSSSDIQSGRPLYKCHVCSRSFRGSAYLRFHLRSHTGERPYKCAECDKAFTTKDMLNKHISTHSEERNYKCGECGKLFKRISHVREHLKIHSIMRPFPCSVCDKSFKTANALKVHLRIHTDVLPYECRFCQRHFREKGSLQRHMRMHTGERPFQCKYCSRGFAEHGTLNRHMKAKVPCIRQVDYDKEKDTEVTNGTYPTVLAEFSSVVADTQQYIVSDAEAKNGSGQLETAEYVVLHTDLSSEEIIQNVEISAGSAAVEHTLLENAGSEETASYIVVSTDSQAENLDVLDIQSVESLILPAGGQVVQQSDIEAGVVKTEDVVEDDVSAGADHNAMDDDDVSAGSDHNAVDNDDVSAGADHNAVDDDDVNTSENLDTVALVQQTIAEESNEIRAIAMAPLGHAVSVAPADTIHQAMMAADMVDPCNQDLSTVEDVQEVDAMDVSER